MVRPFNIAFICVLLSCCSMFNHDCKNPLEGERRPVDTTTVSSNKATHSHNSNFALFPWQLKQYYAYKIQHAYGSTPYTPPIITRDYKLIVLQSSGQVIAYDLQNHSILWKNNFFKNITNTGGFSNNNFISGGISRDEDGVVYMTAGIDYVIAIEVTTGTTIWKQKLDSPSRAIPISSTDKLFIQASNNHIYALDKRDGKILWHYIDIGDNIRLLTPSKPLIVDNNLVTLSSDSEITAINTNNGQAVWSVAFNSLNIYRNHGDIALSPLAGDLYIYVITNRGEIVAVDKKHHTIAWNQYLDIKGQLVEATDFLYALTRNNKLIAVSKSNGSLIWDIELAKYQSNKDKIIEWSTPTIFKEHILLVSSDGDLVCFNIRNGVASYKTRVQDAVFTTPITSLDSLYLVSNKGEIIQYNVRE